MVTALDIPSAFFDDGISRPEYGSHFCVARLLEHYRGYCADTSTADQAYFLEGFTSPVHRPLCEGRLINVISV